MLKIGEFSKLSRVSIRMLRHYDDIGLLVPAKIDTFTGYRYYEVEQLMKIGRITTLKDMGFTLADIIKIIDNYEDREILDSYLEKREAELKKVSEETAYKLMLLDTARKRLRREQTMSYNVSVKTLPDRYAATVHMIIPCYEAEGMIWETLYKETADQKLVFEEPCLAAASFLDEEYKEKDVELMIWMTVKGKYKDTEHVKFQILPEVKVASCILKGSYDQMNECYAALLGWVSDNKYELNGSMFNIYHVSPAQTQNPDEYVTEVCVPVK